MYGNGCFTKRSFEKWLFRRVVVPGTSHHLFSQHEKKVLERKGIHGSSSVANSGHASVLQCCPCCTISKFKSSSCVLSGLLHAKAPTNYSHLPTLRHLAMHATWFSTRVTQKNWSKKGTTRHLLFQHVQFPWGWHTIPMFCLPRVRHFSRVCTNVKQKKRGPM